MKYLLLFTTLIFAGELEVDGNLKVTGTVDANGNPITNVGAPLLSTDAVNAGTLASSLGIGIIYEYISYKVKIDASNSDGYNWWVLMNHVDPGSWSINFMNELNAKSLDGYEIHSITNLPLNHPYNQDDYTYLLFILKRPISEEE